MQLTQARSSVIKAVTCSVSGCQVFKIVCQRIVAFDLADKPDYQMSHHYARPTPLRTERHPSRKAAHMHVTRPTTRPPTSRPRKEAHD